MADRRNDVGDARGGSIAGSSRNSVRDDLNKDMAGNRGTVGGVTTIIRILYRGIRDTRGVDAGGGLGSAKRRYRNNLGPLWQESRGKLRGGGDWERASHSRSHREVVFQDRKLECWDGYRRQPGGRMNLCGRRRCWDGDRGHPGGITK